VIVVSSLGTERTGLVPFNLENMGGSLDKKRVSEEGRRRRRRRGDTTTSTTTMFICTLLA